MPCKTYIEIAPGLLSRQRHLIIVHNSVVTCIPLHVCLRFVGNIIVFHQGESPLTVTEIVQCIMRRVEYHSGDIF